MKEALKARWGLRIIYEDGSLKVVAGAQSMATSRDLADTIFARGSEGHVASIAVYPVEGAQRTEPAQIWIRFRNTQWVRVG